MRKKITIALFALTSCLNEQDVELSSSSTFVKHFNGGFDDVAQDMKQTSDGGYIILGSTEIINEAAGSSRFKIKLIKTNKSGHVEWMKIYPEFNRSIDTVSFYGRSVVPIQRNLGESGYLIVGDSIQVKGIAHIRVMIVDTKGDIKKVRNIQNAGIETQGIAATVSPKGYLIVGSYPQAVGDKNIFLTELNENLETLWAEELGTNDNQSTLVNKLFLVRDSIFIAGTTYRNNNPDIRFIRLQYSNRDLVDPILNNPNSFEQGNDICEFGFEFAIIGTATNPISGRQNIIVKKITAVGTESDTYLYAAPAKEGQEPKPTQGLAISATKDGGLILLCSIGDPEQDLDLYFFKIDPFGDPVWGKIMGDRNNEIGVSILAADDGGYLILSTTSFGNRNNMTLIKTDELGNIE